VISATNGRVIDASAGTFLRADTRVAREIDGYRGQRLSIVQAQQRLPRAPHRHGFGAVVARAELLEIRDHLAALVL